MGGGALQCCKGTQQTQGYFPLIGLLPLGGLLPLSIITCLDVLQKVVHVILGSHAVTLPLPMFTGPSAVGQLTDSCLGSLGGVLLVSSQTAALVHWAKCCWSAHRQLPWFTGPSAVGQLTDSCRGSLGRVLLVSSQLPWFTGLSAVGQLTDSCLGSLG